MAYNAVDTVFFTADLGTSTFNLMGGGYQTSIDFDEKQFVVGYQYSYVNPNPFGFPSANLFYVGYVDFGGITAPAFKATAAPFDGGDIVVLTDEIIDFKGAFTSISFDDLVAETSPVCFAAGTLIATPGGEVRVEDLRPGDVVLTADGRAVAVRWIGRQTLHRRFTPADRFRPVCVRAGALGEGAPHADLVVTADHALAIDGLLVNAGALVNGTSIVQVPAAALPDRVTYFHVETEAHELLVANGVPAESFLDDAMRRVFDNRDDHVGRFGSEPRMVRALALPRVLSRRQLPASTLAALAERAAAAAPETLGAA